MCVCVFKHLSHIKQIRYHRDGSVACRFCTCNKLIMGKFLSDFSDKHYHLLPTARRFATGNGTESQWMYRLAECLDEEVLVSWIGGSCEALCAMYDPPWTLAGLTGKWKCYIACHGWFLSLVSDDCVHRPWLHWTNSTVNSQPVVLHTKIQLFIS